MNTRTPRSSFLLLLALLTVAGLACAQTEKPPAPETTLFKTLRKGHPRLMAGSEDFNRLRQLITSDPLARQWHQQLQKTAGKLLNEPTVEYKLIGPRLLTQSRRCLERVYTLGLLYRLHGDKQLAERAKKELFAAAEFRDWNPAHFLDTAEMAHAFGIGYDWLYDYLSEAERTTIRTALIEKGLKKSFPFYQENKWWVKVTHNWNQVCNGGLTIGALAIADEEPGLAEFIVSHALNSIRLPMGSYAPDGGWDEGPGYWHYATSYNVYFLAALESALGADFAPLQSLLKMPGFSVTGDFRLHSVGPLGRPFNYADANDRRDAALELFWLARIFNRPVWAWHERMMRSEIGGQPHACNLLWFDVRGAGAKAEKYPLDAIFRGIDVAFFRSAWEDRNAFFIGFKGGNNKANHSHLDLGSFVLDGLGQRWAVDLGGDNYDLPAYFGRERWNYYRLKTVGQNTLLINNADQALTARAPLIAWQSAPERAFTIADLSAAYPMTRRVWRGAAMLDRQRIIIEDEIEADNPVDVVWQMHTPAQIQAEGAMATLTQNNVELQARILSPRNARFESAPATPFSEAENQNKGISKLLVRLPEKIKSERIVVIFETADNKFPALKPEPLSKWRAAAQK